jgi:CubicO group peptidase (beta-lactamase class C family)
LETLRVRDSVSVFRSSRTSAPAGRRDSTYWIDPEEDLVVVHLTQLTPSTGVDDFGKVRALIYQAIVD